MSSGLTKEDHQTGERVWWHAFMVACFHPVNACLMPVVYKNRGPWLEVVLYVCECGGDVTKI